MTTRKILVEQLRNRLAGGQAPVNFPVSELEQGKLIDQVANDTIYIACVKDANWDNFLTTYENVEVKLDEAKNIYYADIPKVISFKNQQGVFQVSSMQDQANIFMPVQANGSWQFSDLNELLEGAAGYYNEQKKIYLVNYSPNNNTNKLLLKLVVDRSELDEEEDYQIPENLVALILDNTLNFNQRQK